MTVAATPTGQLRVLGIGDSDSYVKWGAAVLDQMPTTWTTQLVVVETPVTPTADQLEAALAGSDQTLDRTAVLSLAQTAALVGETTPDVVLLALRGPVVRVMVRAIVAAAKAAGVARPVIVTGLPGISIPATSKALYYRSQADFFLLHSKREIADFTTLACGMGIQQAFGLASLPFLPERRATEPTGLATTGDIIFAAQAKVPKERDDRMRLLGWLIATARQHPTRRVVIKLRGRAGEPQTHAEKYPFDVLITEWESEQGGSGVTLPDNLVIATGALSGHLDSAAGLVTVSSTAAIEAAALGVPVLALDDFGTSAELINLVFEGSNLLASSPELVAAEFRHPNSGWLDENYFHSTSDENWVGGIEALVRRRNVGSLSLRPQYRGRLGGRFRHVWDRKSAFGELDTSVAGTIAGIVGQPARLALMAYNRRRNVATTTTTATTARAADPTGSPDTPSAPTTGATAARVRH